MEQAKSFVAVERHENFAVIRWNRPSRKNAIISEMTALATDYLNQFATDDTVKLVLLTGTGEFYTSGSDFLSSFASEELKSAEKSIQHSVQLFKNFIIALINFPKPLIAAVNGPAIGMGVTTLPLCDVVYASSDSTFLTPFSRIGMVPEACSSYTFPLTMGYSKASEMLLYNRTISASEACSCGLVSEIFPKEMLMKEVYKRIHEFLDNPIMCLIHGKNLLRGRDRQKLLQINEEECARLVERSMSNDFKQQAVKFLQHRMELKHNRNSKL